jgi:hypothetical protein
MTEEKAALMRQAISKLTPVQEQHLALGMSLLLWSHSPAQVLEKLIAGLELVEFRAN